MAPKGFVILGFPGNDFGGQEPGTAEEIKSFCELNYGVTFPLFSKVVTKAGADQSPIYTWLGQTGNLPKWNFSKDLIGKDGKVIGLLSERRETGCAGAEGGDRGSSPEQRPRALQAPHLPCVPPTGRYFAHQVLSGRVRPPRVPGGTRRQARLVVEVVGEQDEKRVAGVANPVQHRLVFLRKSFQGGPILGPLELHPGARGEKRVDIGRGQCVGRVAHQALGPGGLFLDVLVVTP